MKSGNTMKRRISRVRLGERSYWKQRMQRELFAIVLLYLASECHAVHWYFKLGQQRCVMKDIDGGITVTGKSSSRTIRWLHFILTTCCRACVGNYRIEVFDSDIGAYTHRPFGYGIQVSVYDGHGKEMLNRVYSTSGEKFQFYAEREDRHVVCLRPNITTAPHGHAPYVSSNHRLM